MKEIYIGEPDNRILGYLHSCFKHIDPKFEKYKLIINPFKSSRIREVTLQEILGKTNSGRLDLMIFPLHFSEESRRAAESIYEDHAMEFDGVKLGLNYKKQGYSNPILLTLIDSYSGTQAISVENAGGFKIEEIENYFLKPSYLNLYSIRAPKESNIRLLLHLLEGIPKLDVEILHTGPDGKLKSKTIISAIRDKLPEEPKEE